MRISDWSSDVCSSDLRAGGGEPLTEHADRVRVGCRRAKVEARETQPTQPVADQVLHVHVAHFVFASPVPAPSASSPGHTVGDRPWCRSSGPAPPPASAVTPQKSTTLARTSSGSPHADKIGRAHV